LSHRSARQIQEIIATGEDGQRQVEIGLTNPRSVASELLAFANGSPRKVQQNLRELRERRMLPRVGPDKSGHWEILEP